jgi:nucleoside-diphosphate-sugar epimerase
VFQSYSEAIFTLIDMQPPVSIIGDGYTGRRLAERFVSSGACASVRSYSRRLRENSATEMGAGAESLRLDLDAEVKPFDVTGHLVYYTVPPAHEIEDRRLARLLGALSGAPRRLIYLSTTGVYGDRRGATVNEDTTPAPLSERASRRLASEKVLRSWCEERSMSWCILRIPGIYGPGRLQIDRLRQASPAIDPCESTPGNRIHVTDLVSACVAAGLNARADRRIYNVTDGTDDSHTQFLLRVARLACLPLPPLVSREEAERTFSPVSWSFLRESRRVDNSRMLSELEVVLRYGDLDAGILASLDT